MTKKEYAVPEELKMQHKDISESEFRSVNMSGTVFDAVNLSGARFHNVNLRGAEFGAVDFGGATFSCMNTGEDRPREPARFENMEPDDCTFSGCAFRNVKIVSCDLAGMTIDGVLVTDMINAHRQLNMK
jgi:uncharacterized protein YjbI with pentapeptide repeats